MVTRRMLFWQRTGSLACIVLTCLACIGFCAASRFGKYTLFAILCGMMLLFFASAIRYALAKVNQISGSYRQSLCRWRKILFDMVVVVTPVLTALSFVLSIVFCII